MRTRDEFITDLFIQYHDGIERTCLRMVHNNPALRDLVDDCIQEVFFAAAKSYDDLLVHPNIVGWLKVTAFNTMKYELRKRRYRIQLEKRSLVEGIASIDVIEQLLQEMENSELLSQIYIALTDTQQQLFNDAFRHEMSIRDISRKHSITEGNAKVRIHRLRKRIAGLLKNISWLLINFCVTFFVFMQ